MNAKVSILIPTYNRADYLPEAIRSALAQTHKNIEILVLDDASPDSTSEVMAEFSSDPRVRYIRHPKNLGIAENWRAGIEAATGQFFCILHDDDTFEPTFVEELLVPLVQDETRILAFCDHWVMDKNGTRLRRESDAASRQFGRDRLASGCVEDFGRTALLAFSIAVGATLFRRSEALPSFINGAAKGAIDGWLFYQCVKSGLGAYYVPERLMNYRLHAGSMSASMPVYMAEGQLVRYRAMVADPDMSPLHAETQQQMGKALTDYGIALLADGEYIRARCSLRESLRLRAGLRGLTAFGLAYSGNIGVRMTHILKGRS